MKLKVFQMQSLIEDGLDDEKSKDLQRRANEFDQKYASMLGSMNGQLGHKDKPEFSKLSFWPFKSAFRSESPVKNPENKKLLNSSGIDLFSLEVNLQNQMSEKEKD